MIKNLPGNAKQLTPDRELYKIILEEGNKKNRSSNLNNTCVAVFYIIKTFNENENECDIIDFTKRDQDPVAWIVGDKESENSIYLFLQVAVRTMCEGETSKFFFTKKYLLGDAPMIDSIGNIYHADAYFAIVKLYKSTPLDQIVLSSEQKEKNKSPKELPQLKDESNHEEKENKSENINESTSSNEEKANEVIDEESYKRRRFAINQLKIAESLLNQQKPAAARKEFNRATMSWSTQVDLSKAPESITHDNINLPEEEFKKYINSRAAYGVARTFLDITPPKKENAVIKLRESIEIDPQFFEAKMMLEQIGEKVEDDEVPKLEDKRLTKQEYWMKPEVEWSQRVEYSNYVKDKATEEFKENNYKAALDLYKRCIISFSGQSKRKSLLTQEQISTMNKVNIISKLNCLACYLLLKEYQKVVVHANELYDTIIKMEPTIIDENCNSDTQSNNNDSNAQNEKESINSSDNANNSDNANENTDTKGNENKTSNKICNDYKLKCLYRKALAFDALNMTEQVENTIKQIKDIDGSNATIQAIRRKQQEDDKLHQKERDDMMAKIAMSFK